MQYKKKFTDHNRTDIELSESMSNDRSEAMT